MHQKKKKNKDNIYINICISRAYVNVGMISDAPKKTVGMILFLLFFLIFCYQHKIMHNLLILLKKKKALNCEYI